MSAIIIDLDRCSNNTRVRVFEYEWVRVEKNTFFSKVSYSIEKVGVRSVFKKPKIPATQIFITFLLIYQFE